MTTLEEKLRGRVKVAENGCWECQGDSIRWEGERLTVTRAAHILWKGPVPEGLMVGRRCQNKKCVNPEHLFAGTVKEVLYVNLDKLKARPRQVRASGWHWYEKQRAPEDVEISRARYKYRSIV